MTLFADIPPTSGQIVLAAVLAAVGFALLLPQPRGRRVMAGVATLIVAAAVAGAWLYTTFGQPMPDTIGNVMFWLFASGAIGFGTVLVVQKNPARGAIAFAFVILSTCGLFLLLAAPFLMAATVIIYAGAIIVTFLFVLMLSNVSGTSAENDRTREPLWGAFAGFAFVGLILFTLLQTQRTATASSLPAPVLTADERQAIQKGIEKLDAISDKLDTADLGTAQARARWTSDMETDLEPLLQATLDIHRRLRHARADAQARAVVKQAEAVQNAAFHIHAKLETDAIPKKLDVAATKADLRTIRDEATILSGSAELPARNVANIGYLLYADHLLAVELAGTLLLVATIGAVAIAHRKGT